MHQTNIKTLIGRILPAGAAALACLMAATAQAAAPGITGTGTATVFNLTAQPASLNQPDGQTLYSWGYGCATAPTTTQFVGVTKNANCPSMQVPGPTLVVTEGQTVTVNLTNNLPAPAGKTSILFPGFQVSSSGGTPGLLTQEAAPGATVSYTFVASSPGTRAYYSGTQGDLQIEMGLYGAIVVMPKSVPSNCTSGLRAANLTVEQNFGESDYRLQNATGQAGAAYNHPATCYDREYLFQWAEADPTIHKAAQAQIATCLTAAAGATCSLQVPTEPYHPAYFMINGRSMPDDMDANYAAEYPNQPYNGNPHMHPGELVLLRVIGQGRWEHPFHEHANHVRILARDGNLILSKSTTPVNYTDAAGASASGTGLAGILMFTTDTFPGQSFDGIFYFSGRGLNWDMYGHNPGSKDPLATLPCYPDNYGYNTGWTQGASPTLTHPEVQKAVNYYEWCQDHNKPLEANPVGDVPAFGPMTLPNPNIFTNGAWYGGSPYFGPDATLRSDTTLRNEGNGTAGAQSGCVTGQTVVTPGATNPTPNCTNLQPSNTQANPANERGWAFMWHSHNEREITTNNVFPGGMFMMMMVDSREFVIDESM